MWLFDTFFVFCDHFDRFGWKSCQKLKLHSYYILIFMAGFKTNSVKIFIDSHTNYPIKIKILEDDYKLKWRSKLN